MAEYISREAVINEQRRFLGYLDADMIYRLEIATKRIPAVDVRPVVRGKWTRQRITFTSDAEIFLCSACTDISFRDTRFCPNCGAEMRPQEGAE